MTSILLKKMEDRFIFLIILSVANIFGLYSHYSSTFRLLGAIWQGKAVLSVIAIPFMLVYLLRLYKKEIKTAYVLPIAAISLGASSLTSLAEMLLPIFMLIIWIVMCIYNRKIYGIRYLLASLVGPAYVGLFYIFIRLLQLDMQSGGEKFFKKRIEKQWILKWFY
jgi:hypothetical protein